MEEKLEKKYISLKEASEISGYSPDYIGYLIRKGKISGRPVYTNISWQTTAEEVLTYKNREGSAKKKITFQEKIISEIHQLRKKIDLEISIIKLLFRNLKLVLLILILIISFSLLISFVVTNRFSDNNNSSIMENGPTGEKEESLSF